MKVILKLTLIAISTLILPIVIFFIDIFLVMSLQVKYDIQSPIIPYVIALISFILLLWYLKYIFAMRSAFLAGMCVISTLLGAFLCAAIVYATIIAPDDEPCSNIEDIC